MITVFVVRPVSRRCCSVSATGMVLAAALWMAVAAVVAAVGALVFGVHAVLVSESGRHGIDVANVAGCVTTG